MASINYVHHAMIAVIAGSIDGWRLLRSIYGGGAATLTANSDLVALLRVRATTDGELACLWACVATCLARYAYQWQSAAAAV